MSPRPRPPRGTLRALGGVGLGALAGAPLPAEPGAWCVLPAGEGAVTFETDRAALGVTLHRPGAAPRGLALYPAPGCFRSMSVPLDLAGPDLARLAVVVVDRLDDAPLSLTARHDGGARVAVRCDPRRGAPSAALVAYRACGSDPIAFAAQCARRLDAVFGVLADLGLRRAALSLSTRADPPRRERFGLRAGPSPEAWTDALRALARGDACSLEVVGAWGELQVAPATRGASAPNETTLSVDLDRVPRGRERAARAALEDALCDAPDALLQGWCAVLAEAPRPRCVTRWERERGVRALPLERRWMATALRAEVPRAFVGGAWRDGDLAAWHPRGEAWDDAVAARGAASGSPRVRSLWRRTGGAPLQGGIA